MDTFVTPRDTLLVTVRDGKTRILWDRLQRLELLQIYHTCRQDNLYPFQPPNLSAMRCASLDFQMREFPNPSGARKVTARQRLLVAARRPVKVKPGIFLRTSLSSVPTLAWRKGVRSPCPSNALTQQQDSCHFHFWHREKCGRCCRRCILTVNQPVCRRSYRRVHLRQRLVATSFFLVT